MPSSIEAIAQAFHEDAVMYGFTHGELLGGPVANLFDFVQKNGKALEIAARLDVLGITPITAMIRVDMEKDAIGADYNDYLTLIKIGATGKSSQRLTTSSAEAHRMPRHRGIHAMAS